ncbi:MAG: diaminopimelate epimerase [Bacteroidales bacterium]|nr:diaminopimelate epimerase [Bacteroidales bacterium]
MTLYKFSGAGNHFVVLDGRQGGVDDFRRTETITALCKEYRTDGLMILGPAPTVISSEAEKSPYDFSMEFFNPDGSGGMMCGNGGRCITAFADMLGLKPASPDGVWHFLAPDGPHVAQIIASPENPAHPKWIVKLKMIDVEGVKPMMGGYFLNTGTRHFVKFVRDVQGIDMEKDGPELRWDDAFQPEGTNANFVQVADDGLHVRTFEKGVEAETLACGTGITASAIAACYAGIPGQAGNDAQAAGAQKYHLQCRRGDWLQVAFQKQGDRYTDVYLTGPAELIR